MNPGLTSKPLKIMVDIIFTLCSNRSMRNLSNPVSTVHRQIGGRVVAQLLNMRLDLLVLGSLLALLLIGRGAGTG
jgi:hypothetical protein